MRKRQIVAEGWKGLALGLALALISLPGAAFAQSASGGPAKAQAAPPLNAAEIQPPPGWPRLNVVNELGGVAHLFPTVGTVAPFVHNFAYFGGTPPLVYHSGGPIMGPTVIYNIFWVPSTLQNGTPTSMPSKYQNLMEQFARDYAGHGIDNVTTEYYKTIGTTTIYMRNAGHAGGNYVDTSAYPASACVDSATPGACITDSQIQSEIEKVMSIRGWTGGLNHIFMVYTSSGEGSCFNSRSTECSYTYYCAYHSYIGSSPPVIYANMPYGNTSDCQISGIPSPNNDPAADTAMTAASHEITEARTDPLLDAWFDSSGDEIGDECAYDYGNSDSGTFNTYDGGNANQQWNGHYYELQTEFDNHAFAVTGGTLGCVQTGPFALGPSSGL